MPLITFASHLQRHVACPEQTVVAGSLREVIDRALQKAPGLASYVYDDQGAIRKHVAVFIDGQMHLPRNDLTVQVAESSKVFVAQALSGG
jgi:sulfur-carrier protein